MVDWVYSILLLLFGPPFLGEIILGLPIYIGYHLLKKNKKNAILDSEKHYYNSNGEAVD